ncbi:hypothetical protein [Bradyrhizobium sp. WD16]|uniref:hypothetical protein n=1 Tax=Bradyrhizobium sp. WD16 TaxID=1521768 RepID=UPI0020A50EB7|nr:hypothetical protein [Bradyrhizobium sp. WD16]UTD27216.1 hypothetical protein DB459_10065 [Bradyrhizobium sp. WD16]
MIGFPLLLIPIAIVNILVFLMPGVSFTDPIVTLSLMSRAAWTVTFGDALLALGLLLLLLEVVKGSRPGGKYFMDHALALLVCGGAAAEFLLLPRFGNSVFFLLVLMTLVDFLGGVMLRLRQRRLRAATAGRSAIVVAEAPASQPASAQPAPLPVQDNAPQPRPEPVAPPPLATIEPAHSSPSASAADQARSVLDVRPGAPTEPPR